MMKFYGTLKQAGVAARASGMEYVVQLAGPERFALHYGYPGDCHGHPMWHLVAGKLLVRVGG